MLKFLANRLCCQGGCPTRPCDEKFRELYQDTYPDTWEESTSCRLPPVMELQAPHGAIVTVDTCTSWPFNRVTNLLSTFKAQAFSELQCQITVRFLLAPSRLAANVHFPGNCHQDFGPTRERESGAREQVRCCRTCRVRLLRAVWCKALHSWVKVPPEQLDPSTSAAFRRNGPPQEGRVSLSHTWWSACQTASSSAARFNWELTWMVRLNCQT